MQPSLIPWLRAPSDGAPLTLSVTHQDGAEIISGILTDAQGRDYPIEDGIPRLLPSALLDAQKSEIAARDAQAADYDRMAFLKLFGKVEIPLTRHALACAPTDLLLEAGGGTGRMTRLLAGGVQQLVSIDFSFESLRANQRKLRAAGVANVHLVQADLCHLPFASELFDRIVSCQVLEHVPGAQMRRQAVSELARVAKPGASLVLSAYKHSLLTRLFAEKEGAHEGGIPFFRFTRPELRAVLETAFAVRSITGVLVYLHLARVVKK